MVTEILGYDADELYEEGLWAFQCRALPVIESQRGPVMEMPGPVLMTMLNPTKRVLFNAERDANPFFHLMETVWMLSGDDHVAWIAQFNKRFNEYADANGRINGAYGARWRHHFDRDQILDVCHILRKSPNTRRAVIGMWDPDFDLDEHNDIPCNTHIYFRVEYGKLDMTVCNRSNDMIWGMLGANIVHMTCLHELVSSAVGIPLGKYRVFTNNLHIYERHFPLFPAKVPNRDRMVAPSMPMLGEGETIEDSMDDAVELMQMYNPKLYCRWFRTVALPARDAYLERLAGGSGMSFVKNILAPDWGAACTQWILRKEQSKLASKAGPQ